MLRQDFCEKTGTKKADIFGISSVSSQGIKELLEQCDTLNLREKEREQQENPIPVREAIVFRPHLAVNPKAFEVTQAEEIFIISGKRIEQIAIQTDFTNPDAVMRVRDVLRKMGIEKELLRKGAKSGDNIRLGKQTFDFQPELFGKQR